MDLEKRLTNLENNFNALLNRLDREKMYQGADMDGQRASVSNVDANAKEGNMKNAADIDYLAMMVDVEIPTEE